MTQLTLDSEQLDQLILQRLPTLMQQNSQIQELILDLARQNFADRKETDDRFYQLLGELKREREEQARKWEKYTTEQDRKWKEQNQQWQEQNRKWDEQNCKWDEQNRKWDEQNRKWDEQLGELKREREEQARKWEKYTAEQDRKWEEQNQQWQEQNQQWQEQDQKWQEQNRKWDEQNRKWDEQLGELKREREEQARKWEKYMAEQDRKWEEQDQKWQEQNRKWDESIQEQNRKWEDAKHEFDRMHEKIMAIAQKHDRSVGALGARWGLQAESAFRNALAGILEKSFGVQVLNLNDYDEDGLVFGRPDQVELDVIIKNGLLIICEIKSSIDKAGMYIFERKVRFYEKKYQRQVTRMLVISPMVEEKAHSLAEQLGIEVYADSLDVKKL